MRLKSLIMAAALLLALAAAAGGYLVPRLALQGAVYWTMRTMPADLGDVNLTVPGSDWRVALFLVLAAMAATAFFALVPALRATRIEPVRYPDGSSLMRFLAAPLIAKDVSVPVRLLRFAAQWRGHSPPRA